MENFDLGLDLIFGSIFVYAGRTVAPKFRLIGFRPSLRFAPLRARTRKSLLTSSFTHYKMGNHIYTLTSLYKFPIWDIPFPLLFSNSISLLWATISYSYINNFWAYKYTKLISSWRRTMINNDPTKIVSRSHIF